MAESRLYLDTEFTGLHQQTTLISMALVAEDGRSFYAEFTDYAQEQVDDWLRGNVLKHLHLKQGHYDDDGLAHSICGDKEAVRKALEAFLAQFGKVHIWADVLTYDWMLFCQLFGGARNLPATIYYIPFDFATLLHQHGLDPDMDRYDYASQDNEREDEPLQNKHHALYDALVLRACHSRLMREGPG
ncbi:MAG: 3'-5' exoribonuclease [Cyclobacteriaceae bacterium]